MSDKLHIARVCVWVCLLGPCLVSVLCDFCGHERASWPLSQLLPAAAAGARACLPVLLREVTSTQPTEPQLFFSYCWLSVTVILLPRRTRFYPSVTFTLSGNASFKISEGANFYLHLCAKPCKNVVNVFYKQASFFF